MLLTWSLPCCRTAHSVCDPFVVFLFDGQHAQSSVKAKSNDPEWNEQFGLHIAPEHAMQLSTLSVMVRTLCLDFLTNLAASSHQHTRALL